MINSFKMWYYLYLCVIIRGILYEKFSKGCHVITRVVSREQI